ncbi:hypothetical protein ZOSMA_173G00050 [Zostera marina]|uniref:Response regulatory domain-containing protein n=1 Tax=Zostera marina TaxID=29655 RepID=A0A0K9PUE2_ZOSMR|nr:hypothetical protein ZOSMA_173G00050 [Zostera marina]
MDAKSQMHILVVDDSVVDRKVLERLLKNSSFRVTTADCVKTALEFLGCKDGNTPTKTPMVNLIISDYSMPELTGYDLLKRVKESPALKRIPVVIVSSENIPNRINRCLEEGADDFLIKPLRGSDVSRLCSHVLPLL